MLVDRVEAGMAAPVHEHGVVVGGLIVASYRKGRTYSATEQELLLAFAEHVSLALASAKTLDAMTHQALHDSLTGLPNRTLFLDRLEHSLARAARDPEREAAVLFLDLDRFKDVNDRLGHAAGDELLVRVGERLRAALRTEDTAARMSGDEFAVLIEDAVDESHLARLAERLLEALEAPLAVHGREIGLSASIGIARGHANGDSLLRDADVAMYRAKRAGAGTYEFIEPGMRAACSSASSSRRISPAPSRTGSSCCTSSRSSTSRSGRLWPWRRCFAGSTRSAASSSRSSSSRSPRRAGPSSASAAGCSRRRAGRPHAGWRIRRAAGRSP